MPLSKIVIFSASVTAIVLTIIAFIRTPKDQRYRRPKHVKEEGVEYAPEYEPKERKRHVIIALSWVIPLFIAANFLFLPWFNEYVAQAHCYKYGSFTGWHIVSYGMFVAIPLSLAAMMFAIAGPKFMTVIRVGQLPLPNEKVHLPTKYVYGRRARLVAYSYFALLAFFVGLSIWGYFAADKFILSLGTNWPVCTRS